MLSPLGSEQYVLNSAFDEVNGAFKFVETPSSASLPSAPKIAQVTLAAGTSQQLSSVTLTQGVVIKSLTTNTGTLYVGTSAAVTSSNGYPLLNSGETIPFAISNLNTLWIIGTSGDKIAYAGS